MFLTVSDQDIHPVRSGDIEKAALPNACKKAANLVSRLRVQLTTAATNVFTPIWTSAEIPEATVWAIEFYTVFRTTTGTSNRGRFWQTGLFYRDVGGTIAQEGVDTLAPFLGSSGFFFADVFADENRVSLLVRDDGHSITDWDLTIDARELR